MNAMTQILLLSLLAVAMIAVVGPGLKTVFAEQQPGKEIQGPPDMPPMHGPSGICTNRQYLFVLSGGSIIQYDKAGLKPLKTVRLPKPEPQRGGHSEGGRPHGHPSRPMEQPPVFRLDDDALYVLMGPKIFVYRTTDMSLKATVDLPVPESRQP